MCELSVYILKGEKREKAMEGAVRLTTRDGKVLAEGILGESLELEGRLLAVDVVAQEAIVAV